MEMRRTYTARIIIAWRSKILDEFCTLEEGAPFLSRSDVRYMGVPPLAPTTPDRTFGGQLKAVYVSLTHLALILNRIMYNSVERWQKCD
jgi:hypothetical protein